MKEFFKAFLLAGLLISGSAVGAETLRVAAAADLRFAMRDLTGQFEKETGTEVLVTYGSSGNFRGQIENGAPFDLFFSADARYPQQLISTGAADAASLTVYAQGCLVLWAPTGANLHLAERGFDALKEAGVQKIAIANPEHAPYGRAAVAALQKAGLYEEIKSKLVFGENISQAAQFVQSGSAQAGMIALSLTFAESMKGGEKWDIPMAFYPPLWQSAVIVQSSTNQALAGVFLEFVKDAEGRRVHSKYGLTPAASTAKP